MNAHGKSQDDIANSEKLTREMISLLEAVDQRITPQHVARRFRELLDDIGDSSPTASAGELVSLQSFPGTLVETEEAFGHPEVTRETDAGPTETGHRRSTAAAVAGASASSAIGHAQG